MSLTIGIRTLKQKVKTYFWKYLSIRVSIASVKSITRATVCAYALHAIQYMQALCKCMLFAYADIKLLEVVNMPHSRVGNW